MLEIERDRTKRSEGSARKRFPVRAQVGDVAVAQGRAADGSTLDVKGSTDSALNHGIALATIRRCYATLNSTRSYALG